MLALTHDVAWETTARAYSKYILSFEYISSVHAIDGASRCCSAFCMIHPMSGGREVETHIQGGPSARVLREPQVTWRRGDEVLSYIVEKTAVAGASDAANIVVNDPLVSRVHVELETRPDGLWVRDLGSRNGTWVENLRIDRCRVPDGGTIRIGNTELRVQYRAGSAEELWPADRFGVLVGRSAKMRELFATLARIAPSDSSALIQGETGTGKELVARALHDASPRAKGPFVVVDCGALAENLLDAELFGHTKGAFTGAVAARAGAIEEAHGGTVFLDEIGELPLSLQPKLLRAVESRTVRRVGEVSFRRVDVRFVAATHRSLLDMVGSGDFREDLFFRLAVLPIAVPPLRERLDDVEPLVMHFLGAAHDKITPQLLGAMKQRTWRGNVRELRNFVERARTLGAAEALALMDPPSPTPAPSGSLPSAGPLPDFSEEDEHTERTWAQAPPIPSDTQNIPIPVEQPFKAFRETWIEYGERAYVEALLARAPKPADAIKAAGVDRSYLYRLIRKYTR